MTRHDSPVSDVGPAIVLDILRASLDTDKENKRKPIGVGLTASSDTK
jgi:hypothetical protein